MKHERSLQEQTRRIDEQKQDRTLLIPKGQRQPEGIRDTNFLFDGVKFYIRYKGEWHAIGGTDTTDIDAIQEVIDDNIPFSTQL